MSILTTDGKESVQVTANITAKDTGAVSNKVKQKIKETTLPEGVTTTMGGVSQMMSDTFSQMYIAMVIAVFAVFLVMMIALGGLTAPLSILFSCH